MIGGRSARFTRNGDIVELLAEEATDTIADAIAHRYANPALLAQVEEVAVRVVGLRNSTEFARARQYLQSLDAVQQLFIDRIADGALHLRLSVRGGLERLRQSVNFGSVLVADELSPQDFRLAGGSRP